MMYRVILNDKTVIQGLMIYTLTAIYFDCELKSKSRKMSSQNYGRGYFMKKLDKYKVNKDTY